jgi:four helix bundle protein
MLNFQKLIVYQKSIDFYMKIIDEIIKKNILDRNAKDQIKRAAMSVTLNIAEGSSRFSKADQRNFYTISRGSIYECIAVVDLITKEQLISSNLQNELSTIAEEISKMLFAMEKREK